MMRIISWNVNGLRAVDKKGLFLPMIDALKPDILCLQETKALPHESTVKVPQYREYWNAAEKKGYSGTALFTLAEPVSVTSGFSAAQTGSFALSDQYGDANAEGRVITAEYEDFFVISVYTPNSKGDLSRLPLRSNAWDPAFLSYCKSLESEKPVIFGGDLNVAHSPIDLANPKENEGEHGYTAEERAGINRIQEAGFVDTFRLFHAEGGNYTWWTPWRNARERNIGWRIDYLFVSGSLQDKVTEAEIHPQLLGSDHCPVSIDITI